MKNRRRFCAKTAKCAVLVGLAIISLFAAVEILSPWSALSEDAAPAVTAYPTVTISPAVVPYKEEVRVLISGSGFKPGTVLRLRIPIGKANSDIRYLVEPEEPVTNEFGAFACVWKVTNFIKRKLIKATAYTLTVLDMEDNKLATAPLVFCDPKDPVCAFLEEPKAKVKKAKKEKKK